MQGWTQDKLAVQLLTVTARLQSATLHNNNKYPDPVPVLARKHGHKLGLSL